jgi:hypothetical protein
VPADAHKTAEVNSGVASAGVAARVIAETANASPGLPWTYPDPRPSASSSNLLDVLAYQLERRYLPSLSPAPGGFSKNSMPRSSSARLTASAVRDIKLSPRSNLLIVEVDTHAFSASSRTPIRKAARAILH